MADTLLYRVYGSKNARCLHTVGSPDATSDGAATAAYFSVHVALVRACPRGGFEHHHPVVARIRVYKNRTP
jgi:hypothetical protein